jgi:hypothetical protein
MQGHRPPLSLALGLLVLAACAGMLAAPPRAAGVAAAQPAATVVAGPSPFAPGCEGTPLASRVYLDSAVEPMLAVNPKDPRHLAAIWMQDRIATSAARGVLVAISRDGGQTWTRSAPAFSRCTGGTPTNGGDYPRVADPWLSFAPNGDLYSVALALNAFAGPSTTSAILVSRSTDGGITWADPITVAREPIAAGFNDKPTLTADPFDARFAYVVWDRDFLGSQTESGLVEAPAYFARTTDGGRSWEPPRLIYRDQGAATIGPVLVVLPNGDLVNIFSRRQPDGPDGKRDLALVRSSDRGATWSAPASVAGIVPAPLADPYSTYLIQPNPSLAILPSVAVDPSTGQMHVVWADGRFSTGEMMAVNYTTSADGGVSWSSPVKVGSTPDRVPAFVPGVAVLPDGTVGVAFYDLRAATPDGAGIATSVWLATCRDDCTSAANWQETAVAGPFDLARAPYARGFFVGDYLGIAATADGFRVFFISTLPGGALGASVGLVAAVAPSRPANVSPVPRHRRRARRLSRAARCRAGQSSRRGER